MRRHPRLGLELAAPLVSWLGEWAGGIADHHENFDGSGYPEGKAGQGIALAGRMIRVADTYDVMTSVRSYKKPVSPEAARRELVDGSGRFFDPEVVRSFLRIGLGRLRWTAGPLSWLAQTPILRALEVARELGTAAAAAGAATVGAAALGVNLMLPAGADAAVPPVPPVSDHVIVVEAGTTHTESIITAELSAAGFAVVVDEPPGHGTAEAGAGGIAYTPEPGYTGPDTVGFQVVGAGGSAVGAAHLVISVVPGEAVPGPVDDSAATSEDQAVVIEVLANDPAGSTVQSVTAPGHGTAALQADGRIRYQPAADFSGTDSFRYEAAAGGRSLGTAVVTVEVAPVADPPVARPDSVSADAGRAVVVRVLENDDDPDGDLDPSTLRLLEGPARGEARVAGGGIWYRPEEGAGGSDRLLYEICDRGGLCATAEVACTVAAVNRPPAAADDSAATRRGTAVTIDVLANDTDPDGDPLTISSVGEGSLGGTATCPAAGPCRYVPPVFPAGSHGTATDTFTYTVADPAGAEGRATVTVTIDLGDLPAPAVNRPPTARPERGRPPRRIPPEWPSLRPTATPTRTATA